MIVALFIGVIYSLPNLFGEAPAVQISSSKATLHIDAEVLKKVEQALSDNHISAEELRFDNYKTNPSIRIRLSDLDTQLRTRDVVDKTLNTEPEDPAYSVALNLQSASPKWLSALGAYPTYLGLDLRGGVYFLLQVDKAGALNKRLDAEIGAINDTLRRNSIYLGNISREQQTLVIKLTKEKNADKTNADSILKILREHFHDLDWVSEASETGLKIAGRFTELARRQAQTDAVTQNILTLHNRVNELGVAEPVIQQQGEDRIVVQLPGVQDTAKAKEIIGRTATLEARLATLDAPQITSTNTNNLPPAPFGSELFTHGDRAPVYLKKQIIFSGDRIINASATFDEQQRPAVSIRLDSIGGRVMRDVSRANIGKPMGIVLFEKNKGEVLTVATIQSEFGQNFQITGAASTQAANDLALLLRAGSLAAPMDIIEERTIGPSLGADNILKGFKSVAYGFTAIVIFMVFYYLLFGAFSAIALSLNLLLLIAVLSMLQATLTLPGIAAIALTLGMAIDSNVLINERIREELRLGVPPQSAISLGFKHAWATILDSNVTTLIAGLALLAFGSGPVRGFAVVHCIGIVTSMFSSVFFARGLVNLWYGGKKRLQTLAIGQIWRASGDK